MVQAGQFRLLQGRADGVGGDICQQVSTGGGADLIVDDGETLAFLGKA